MAGQWAGEGGLAVTDYPYEPPERMLSDTLLAFRDFELASTWGVRVENDWLGDVNQIVSLMHVGKRIRGALWPVHPGAVVRLVRDEAYYSIAHLRAFRDALWDTRGTDQPAPTIEVHPPGWRIEVDGETVLRVPDETKPVPPRPAIPWRTRAQWRLRKWFYAAIDRVVVPLGYHHEDDCGDYR